MRNKVPAGTGPSLRDHRCAWRPVAAGYLLFRASGADLAGQGAFIVAVSPAEITSALVAVLAGATTATATVLMTVSVGTGCILTPLWLALLGRHAGNVDRGSIVFELVASVALPLVVGVMIRTRSAVVARHPRRCLDLAGVSLLLVVFVGAGAARPWLLSSRAGGATLAKRWSFGVCARRRRRQGLGRTRPSTLRWRSRRRRVRHGRGLVDRTSGRRFRGSLRGDHDGQCGGRCTPAEPTNAWRRGSSRRAPLAVNDSPQRRSTRPDRGDAARGGRRRQPPRCITPHPQRVVRHPQTGGASPQPHRGTGARSTYLRMRLRVLKSDPRSQFKGGNERRTKLGVARHVRVVSRQAHERSNPKSFSAVMPSCRCCSVGARSRHGPRCTSPALRSPRFHHVATLRRCSSCTPRGKKGRESRPSRPRRRRRRSSSPNAVPAGPLEERRMLSDVGNVPGSMLRKACA